jgi:Cu-Zn family superoxide dismutase
MTIAAKAKVVLASLGLLAIVAALLVPEVGADPQRDRARADLANAAGERIGGASFSEKDGVVEVAVKVRGGGLTPGFHGLHIHWNNNPDNGSGCIANPSDPPTSWFVSADGHYNPSSTGHGAHAGDMPSLFVKADGTAVLQFETDAVTVAGLANLAVIIHGGRDNFANIPTRYHSHTEDVFGPDSATNATGDSGYRAACGVIGTDT